MRNIKLKGTEGGSRSRVIKKNFMGSIWGMGGQRERVIREDFFRLVQGGIWIVEVNRKNGNSF